MPDPRRLLSAAALIGAFFVFAESSLAMVNLGLATLAALVIGIGNLIPNEDGQTDGWLAREAWRRWHGTPDWRKPLAVVEEREAEESFTRGVLTAAHGEAAAAGSSYMGTDHLLAALAGLDDHVGAALRAAGLRAQTDEASESAMRAVGALSPSLKRSLERAGKQAAERGAPEVVPEDLLLALLVEREGRAYELLQERGMSASDLHREMLEEKVR